MHLARLWVTVVYIALECYHIIIIFIVMLNLMRDNYYMQHATRIWNGI